jgi:hypothetical protein
MSIVQREKPQKNHEHNLSYMTMRRSSWRFANYFTRSATEAACSGRKILEDKTVEEEIARCSGLGEPKTRY